MADFLLSVGVDVGLSYDQMQKDISGLVSQLNSNPPKIKVDLEIDSAALNSIREQVSQLSSMSTGKSGVVATGAADVTGIRKTARAWRALDKAMKQAAETAKSTQGIVDRTNTESKKNTTGIKELERDTTGYYNALKKIDTMLTQVRHNQEQWTAAKYGKTRTQYNKFADYESDLKNLDSLVRSGHYPEDKFKERAANISSDITATNESIKAAGEATKSWSDRVGSLSAKFGTWLSISQVIMAGVRAVKQMVGNVVELDTAMTELKKVTNETDATYEKFLDKAGSRAKEVGASLSDTVTATADFARLGYNIEDAEKLADSAIIYKNVGDGIEDISTASESIIATMQAFGISADDVMSIVDKFNEVGNNYAISSKGVGDALLRSAAAMHAANNSLDETIALATAANTVVQDPDKVGTTLKTVSMFLRAAKTEAEDAGESTEGMATSVSKLRDEILALTGNKVDIQIDDDTFKSTYQILKELSSVWNDLTDITQANILERVGGKRNSNVVAALLENFSVAEAALQTSSDSTGSALSENDKVLESIQGRLNILKATFQEFSQSAVSADFLKSAIDGATTFINVMEKVAKFLSLPIIKQLFTGSVVAGGVGILANLLPIQKLVDKLSGGGLKNLTLVKGFQGIFSDSNSCISEEFTLPRYKFKFSYGFRDFKRYFT